MSRVAKGNWSGSVPVLSRRALNRALLERQRLLRRGTHSVAETIEHLVGMQAQVPNNPYVGLWARLKDFRPEELSQMIAGRQAVRLAVMRSTLHLLTAPDCLALRPVMQPVLDRALYRRSPFGRGIAGIDVDRLVATGRALLEERPRTISELRALLHEQWPERDASSLAYAVHYLLPLVQLPPRGIWGKSGRPTCTTAEAWLGQPMGPVMSIDDLVVRYLAAFGPATPGDMQAWSGLQSLGEVFERLRSRLVTFRDERGRELFDLPDAPRPVPETPAPPRFLPEYDNVLLGHADRSRIISDEHRQRISSRAGVFPVLVDGFVAGSWRLDRARGPATLTIEPLQTLTNSDHTSLTEEGMRLLGLLAADATPHVEFTPRV